MNPAAPILTRVRGRGVNRSQAALLLALAVDNVGSGLFLPLGLVYATRVVGLSVGTAGIALVVSAGIAAWRDKASRDVEQPYAIAVRSAPPAPAHLAVPPEKRD